MSRLPRPCPSCGEVFQPRKVGGTWTKTCSKACANEAVATAMRNGGGRRAALAMKRPERVALTCEVCGKVWELPPSQVRGRRTCSKKCGTELLKRTQAGSRAGAANPNFRHGDRSGLRSRAGERRWRTALGTKCAHPGCNGAQARLALHHLIYAQEVRRLDGDVWDPRNALTLCSGCHGSHHQRVRVLPLSAVPTVAFDFAEELMGVGAAYEYLRRTYVGADARLDAMLARWEDTVAPSGESPTIASYDGKRDV